MTLTVTSFNATTGKVNVTLTDSSMEFLLSGESSINHLSSTSSPPPPFPPLATSVCHFHLFWGCLDVNQSITKWSHAWEWKLTIGSKDGCISLCWLTNCPLKSLFSSFLTAFLYYDSMHMLSQEQLEGISSYLTQTSIWNQGWTDQNLTKQDFGHNITFQTNV